MCGLSHLIDKPYLYFPSPLVDLNVAFCVNECPLTTGFSYFLLFIL